MPFRKPSLTLVTAYVPVKPLSWLALEAATESEGHRPTPMGKQLLQPCVKLVAEDQPSLGCDRDGASAAVTVDPATLKAVRAQRCADRAGNMRAPLAPI